MADGKTNVKTDILMSIKPEHMANIATGVKNHEYRKYLLRASVRRIWFYTTHPHSRIEYVAQISPGRKPGEVPEDGGLGNDDFNAGKKVSKVGYAIEKLWKIVPAVSFAMARQCSSLKAPPQKYNYAPAALVDRCALDDLLLVLPCSPPNGSASLPET